MTYKVYERSRLTGYEATASTARPYLETGDLARARAEARSIAEFGLAAFVWDGAQCIYDPEGDQLTLDLVTPGVESLF